MPEYKIKCTHMPITLYRKDGPPIRMEKDQEYTVSKEVAALVKDRPGFASVGDDPGDPPEEKAIADERKKKQDLDDKREAKRSGGEDKLPTGGGGKKAKTGTKEPKEVKVDSPGARAPGRGK